MEPIKQSTYETCLACCLLMLIDGDINDEIEIWKHGWKFNFLMGQLNYVADKYNKKFKAYIENQYYFNHLKLEKGENVELINKKNDIELLNELLENGEVIIYLDFYYLQPIIHAPHHVLVTKKIGDLIEFIDSADGQIKTMDSKFLEEAIESLRSHLKYSPVFLVLT